MKYYLTENQTVSALEDDVEPQQSWAEITEQDAIARANGPVTVSHVEAERDQRLALASFTQARLALGDATSINIVTNTGPVSVTPTEWMDIVNTGGAGRQAIWQYYFTLIAMDPIPSDYQDDQYWSPSE